MKAFIKFALFACAICLLIVSGVQAATPDSSSDGQKQPSVEKSEQASREPVENPAPIAMDLALSGKDGLLLGQLVDPNGAALANQAVRLVVDNHVMARGKSDKRGYFAFRHLRGGVYQVASKDSFVTVRAWSDGTAPKSAKPKVLLVVGRETVRAQQSPPENGKCGSRIGRLLKRPVVVAGIVATAVAVPLSVNSSKKSTDSPGSVTPVPEVVEGVGGVPASQ